MTFQINNFLFSFLLLLAFFACDNKRNQLTEIKKDGDHEVFINYYPEGSVKSTITYKNGLPNIRFKEYSETGNLLHDSIDVIISDYSDALLQRIFL